MLCSLRTALKTYADINKYKAFSIFAGVSSKSWKPPQDKPHSQHCDIFQGSLATELDVLYGKTLDVQMTPAVLIILFLIRAG